MKTRIIIIILLLLVLTVLLTRNDERIADTLVSAVNPVKQSYKKFTQGLEDKSQSYLFQKETIEKFSHENRILRKRLLEQMHYIGQVQKVYKVLPDLSKHPVHSISIADTISYVKLNSFTQIILTRPKDIEEGKLYGLIQGTVAAGVASVKNGQLYGYLTSDSKCRFSVYVGGKKAPGIAIGVEKNVMLVKFIPKWYDVKVGDRVVSSGLDNIFFANVPVGVVTEVEVQSAYTVAYIKTYSNVLHPKTFFVINDPKPTLLENFDRNMSKIEVKCKKDEPKVLYLDANDSRLFADINSSDINNSVEEKTVPDFNSTLPILSSIPTRVDQTQEEVLDPVVPAEHAAPEPVKKHVKKKKHKKKKYVPHKSLDLF